MPKNAVVPPTKPCGRLCRTMLALLLFQILTFLHFAPDVPASEAVVEELRKGVGVLKRSPTLLLKCEPIHSGEELVRFYEDRSYRPLWVTSRTTNELGTHLPAYFKHAADHGLNPEDYHHSCIQSMLESIAELHRVRLPVSPRLLAELDILMTDGFMVYTSHLASGKVNPAHLHPQWLSERNKADILEGLDRLLVHRDLERTMRQFAPPHREYWDLLKAGLELRETVSSGGWPLVPEGPTLRRGDEDPRVPALRQRLLATGNSHEGGEARNANLYDEDLFRAVQKFQARHGLDADGVVGPQTYRALNVSAEARHRQILLNLERWRWLPHEWDDRYVLVNTAAFHMDAWKDRQRVLSMKVIVGKDYQKTPVFSEKMTYLEINPYWNVPRSIAVKEYLPKIRANPGFLASNHFELLQGRGRDVQVIDPWSVDWSSVTPNNFRWFMRQTPGPWNALGHIKFMFPNPFHVYMHDTPQRHLFHRNHRALSHGCIRIEKPMELALLLLEDHPSWTRERIESIIASGNRRVVTLPRPWTVHLYYWTAWVDEAGEIQFRPDLYDRDGVLLQALKS